MSNNLRVRAMLLAVSFALLAAGCSGGGSGVAGAPALQKAGNLEKTTLNVAVLPAIDSAGFFVAMHEGLFAHEGLTVNYTPAFGDQVIGGQAKGQYDVTGMNYVSYITAQFSHVANLRIIAEGSLLQPGSQVIMAMPKSKITSLSQLKGRVLGVSPDANVGFLLISSRLADNGIAAVTKGFSASSVMFPTGDFPFPASQPLATGKVAAAILAEPYATQMAEQYGAVTIADTNRAAVEAAFVALKDGEGHVDKTTATLMALNNYPLSISTSRLQRVADVMREFGFLKQRFDIRTLLSS